MTMSPTAAGAAAARPPVGAPTGCGSSRSASNSCIFSRCSGRSCGLELRQRAQVSFCWSARRSLSGRPSASIRGLVDGAPVFGDDLLAHLLDLARALAPHLCVLLEDALQRLALLGSSSRCLPRLRGRSDALRRRWRRGGGSMRCQRPAADPAPVDEARRRRRVQQQRQGQRTGSGAACQMPSENRNRSGRSRVGLRGIAIALLGHRFAEAAAQHEAADGTTTAAAIVARRCRAKRRSKANSHEQPDARGAAARPRSRPAPARAPPCAPAPPAGACPEYPPVRAPPAASPDRPRPPPRSGPPLFPAGGLPARPRNRGPTRPPARQHGPWRGSATAPGRSGGTFGAHCALLLQLTP